MSPHRLFLTITSIILLTIGLTWYQSRSTTEDHYHDKENKACFAITSRHQFKRTIACTKETGNRKLPMTLHPGSKTQPSWYNQVTEETPMIINLIRVASISITCKLEWILNAERAYGNHHLIFIAAVILGPCMDGETNTGLSPHPPHAEVLSNSYEASYEASSTPLCPSQPSAINNILSRAQTSLHH